MSDLIATLSDIGLTATLSARNVAEGLPEIAGAGLDDENVYIDLHFTEPIYNTNTGSGAIDATDLALTFSQNVGDATAASISSVKKIDGATEASATALAGGEIAVRVFIDITGTPSGVETIKLAPADSASIFDAEGNAVATSESATVILNVGYTAETVAYRDRVETDGGSIIDIDYVDTVFRELKNQGRLADLKQWSAGRAGLKKDVSDFIAKTYDLSNTDDTTQATATSQPVFVTNKVDYDGTDDFLDFGVNSKTSLSFIQNTAIFTIGIKIKLADYTAAKLYPLLNSYSGSLSTKGLAFYYDNRTAGENKLVFQLAKGVSPAAVDISYLNAITDNLEHTITVTGNGTTVYIYIDNTQVVSGTVGTLSTGDSSYTMMSGRMPTTSFYLNGEKDNFYILNSYSTEAQITALNAL